MFTFQKLKIKTKNPCSNYLTLVGILFVFFNKFIIYTSSTSQFFAFKFILSSVFKLSLLTRDSNQKKKKKFVKENLILLICNISIY